MNYLHIIENFPFSTSLTSPLNGSTLYRVSSRRGPEGWWSDVIYRVELEDADGDASVAEKHQVHTELATVLYIDASTTRVRFARSLALGDREEGVLELELDAFLRRTKAYSKWVALWPHIYSHTYCHAYHSSRIFVGLDGMTYKWRIDGDRLEVYSVFIRSLLRLLIDTPSSSTRPPKPSSPAHIHVPTSPPSLFRYWESPRHPAPRIQHFLFTPHFSTRIQARISRSCSTPLHLLIL